MRRFDMGSLEGGKVPTKEEVQVKSNANVASEVFGKNKYNAYKVQLPAHFRVSGSQQLLMWQP